MTDTRQVELATELATISEQLAAVPPERGGRRLAVRLLVPVSYLLGALAVTARLWADPGGLRIAQNPHDIALYSWWLGWWPHAVATLQDPFVPAVLNAPDGVSAMSNTSVALPALAFGWLTAIAGPEVTYNVLSVLAPALSAWVAYLCARRLGLRRPAAYAGGLAFGFAPAVMHSLIGHLSMALAFLLPLLVLLGVRAATTANPRRTGLALGAVALAQLFIGEEVLFQAGIATLVVLIAVAVSHRQLIRQGLATALRSYAYALAVFVPLSGYALYQQFLGALRQHGSPFGADNYATDLLAFVTPSERLALRWGSVAEYTNGNITEHLAYLGLPLLAICVWAIVTQRSDVRVRALGAGLVCSAVLAMGTAVWVAGQRTTVQLPWARLRNLPVLENALPTRLGLLTALFAAALLAFAVDGAMAARGEPLRRLVMAVACVGVVATLLPAPFEVERLDPIPAYFTAEARQLPAGTTAVLVPYPTPRQTEAMRWQAAAGYRFAMPGGFFIGPAPDGSARINASLAGAVPGPTEGLLVGVERTGTVPELTPAARAAVASELAHGGVDVVILGPGPHHGALREALTSLLGSPADVNGVAVWERPHVVGG